MWHFKQYLSHRLKTVLWLTVVLCVLAVILVQFSVRVYKGTYYEWDEGKQESIEYKRINVSNFGIAAIIFGVACTLMPVLELGGLKNRKNIDALYALPVSRFKMALAHYLSGFIQAALIYTAAYITLVLKMISSPLFDQIHSPILLLPCYFVILLAGAAVYSIFTAIFNLANTVADGCFFIAVWSLLPSFVIMALENLGARTGGVISLPFIENGDYISPYPHSALNISENFYAIFIGEKNIPSYVDEMVFWTVIAAALAGLYFYSFARARAENIEGPSSALLGYRIIIPLITFCLSISTDIDLASIIFAILAAIVGYMLYRRSFRIKIKDMIIPAVIITVAQGLVYLLE